MMASLAIERIDLRILNEFQRGFPLCERPYLTLGDTLGISEEEVIERLGRLCDSGHISRIGAVVQPGSMGVSTLAAMQVPLSRIDEIAAYINAREDVNHNYLREHHYNMWFVMNCTSEQALELAVDEIECYANLPVLMLRMLKDYHLDLGFDLQ
ncbi:MAG: Lrp/AsnC family transcriptional regulator [Parahaliea sp.]